MRRKLLSAAVAGAIILSACNGGNKKEAKTTEESPIQKKVNEFVAVDLKSDISFLSENEKKMLPYLFNAAKVMNEIFWTQIIGEQEEFLSKIDDKATKEFAVINYGPWEALNNNKSFMANYGERPAGVNYYPADMTDEEFNALEDETKSSLYTLVKRNAEGKLYVEPYHVAYKERVAIAVENIRKAAELAEDPGLKKYLELRAEALLTDEYLASDMAWMDMKTNNIDFVVGPIENYQDQRYGYKAAHEAFILIKDPEWSKKLAKFAALLPKLQLALPVDAEYKAEVPGSDSDLGVYDAVYYAGDCNAGSKTIAINLPNDERVHIEKGSRKLQLKNSMKYKFDKILVPISEMLIAKEQRKHVKFDAFFENTMFHEVGHGLGIKNTINGKGAVRKALKATYSSIEENKADLMGVFIVKELANMGEIENKDIMDNYVTFMAGLFRSIRFGASSAHGKANMIRFNYFNKVGAFTKTADGFYVVNKEKMEKAIADLTKVTLEMQGNGDIEAAEKMIKEMGNITPELQADLDKVNNAGIPRDIRFNQGQKMLGL
ncbi:MAG: Zn-dependent hydrolase [Bacteroidales bacterium]|jgi:hypothetical protein|nr:Zn-dependent hydrolase [Bacteroidales bacterium]